MELDDKTYGLNLKLITPYLQIELQQNKFFPYVLWMFLNF
jgi:hypothetical protein